MHKPTSNGLSARFGWLLLVGFFAIGSVHADPAFSLETGAFSGFDWRGPRLDDASLFRPSVTLVADSLSFKSPGFELPLEPSATGYDYHGLGIGHGLELGKMLDLTLGATIAAGSRNDQPTFFGANRNGPAEHGAGVELNWNVNETFGIAAGVNYSTQLESDLGDAAGALYFADSRVTLSVAASFEF